jgi:hypothetical protein
MDLDRELRAALARREPPPGFADRVLARVAVEREVKSIRCFGWFWRPAFLRVALASLLIVALTLGGVLEYRRRQGEIAKARLVLALYIAGAKLSFAQEKTQQLDLNIVEAMQRLEEKK